MMTTIAVLGGINQDLVLSVPSLPRPGETVAACGSSRSAGGKGLNQAVAAARQGVATCILGAVGADAAGDKVRAVMVDAGIDVRRVATVPDMATGQAIIHRDAAGENMIVVDGGANAWFGKQAMLASAADNCLSGARVVLTQFEAQLDAIPAFFQQATGALRILNTAPALPEGRSLLPLADILVMNEIELQTYADLPQVPEEEDSVIAAARSLLASEEQIVIVTRGAQGALLVRHDSIIAVPACRVEAVDTIGAGDCYCGVLAAALASGAPLDVAMRRAGAAAALAVTRPGAADAMPDRAEVDRALELAALA